MLTTPCFVVSGRDAEHRGIWFSVARVHELAVKRGYESTAFGEARIEDVRFHERDHLSWAAVISKLAKCGQARRALSKYEEMRKAGVQPSSHTFVAGLKACRSLRNLEAAKQVHAEVVQTGFESDVYVATMLVDVYVKCGRLVDARKVFDSMPLRNVVTWNAMILGYAQMEESDAALQLYERMQQEGVVADDRTFVSALKACTSRAASEEGSKGNTKHYRRQLLDQIRAIHSHIVRSGFESDVFVGTMLVDVYSKCGCLVDARSIFEKMHRRDVVAWTAIIFGYAQMERGEVALEMYAKMQGHGLSPNSRTFVGALKACTSLLVLKKHNQAQGIVLKDQCLEKVRAIHSDIIKGGYELDVHVGSMLVDVYAKCGSLVDARHVFEKMPHRNVVSWTAMILGYSQIGAEVAVGLYVRMQQEGINPNDRTFVGVLMACSNLATLETWSKVDGRPVKHQSLNQVRLIHTDIIRSRMECNMFVGTMLVDVFCKCGSLVDARHAFEKMDHHDVVSWTAMIAGYTQMDEGDVALQCYAQMQQEGIVPDDRTFVAALQACGSVIGLEKGREIHAQISKLGYDARDLFVASALVDMYAKCGRMEDAQQAFDACIPTRDIVTWNSLIEGYARQGDSAVVFDLFERMRLEGIQPNGPTYLSILSVSSHVGLVEEGQKSFQDMTSKDGITPTIGHYTCMVDLLGRAGHLEQALAMVMAMPFQPDSAVWNTVLGACQKWNNVELGRQAFDCAIRLDMDNATAYALMANIYSAARMFEEAKGIQAMRVSTGSWKQQGQSWWRDMSGIVHSFVVEDQEHSECRHLYDMLRDLAFKVEKGYTYH